MKKNKGGISMRNFLRALLVLILGCTIGLTLAVAVYKAPVSKAPIIPISKASSIGQTNINQGEYVTLLWVNRISDGAIACYVEIDNTTSRTLHNAYTTFTVSLFNGIELNQTAPYTTLYEQGFVDVTPHATFKKGLLFPLVRGEQAQLIWSVNGLTYAWNIP